MRTKQGQQVLNLQVTEGLTVEITPNKDHDFTLPTKEVAKGYGIAEKTIRNTKANHSDELIEGKHFIFSRASNMGSKKNQYFKKMYWTKAGIVRLGFFVRSKQAKLFRTWAENLILEKLNTVSIYEPKNERDIYEYLMKVDNREAQKGLYEAMKKGGIL